MHQQDIMLMSQMEDWQLEHFGQLLDSLLLASPGCRLEHYHC